MLVPRVLADCVEHKEKLLDELFAVVGLVGGH